MYLRLNCTTMTVITGRADCTDVHHRLHPRRYDNFGADPFKKDFYGKEKKDR